ncbi:MAG: AAA family ATPase [Verrucomicrobiaceae bacterium]|nr:AAA family ATPase [Verrucomicrobiaceae bacterium]
MFIGRDEELKTLRRAITAREARIAVVYGRRRIGKTSLIRQAVGRAPALFIEGLEGRSTQAQIQSFITQASRQLHKRLPECGSWQDALMALDAAMGKRPMIIVLDEFQWLANYRQELVSTLKMVWENYIARAPGRTLILCGSIASFMTTKVIRSSAFYGRTDVVVHLQGFRLAETARLLRGRGFQEVLDAQCFTGGVPKYLELLAAAPSVALGMEKEAFRPQGFFVEEYERIFVSHFGRNAEYPRLVRVLAAAPYGLHRRELAARADIAEGGMLSQRLYDLEAAGFISSHTPFDKEPGSRLIRYYISDPWISFHHAFLRTRLKQIHDGGKKNIFISLRQTGAFRAWMGRAFELVCLRHQDTLARLLGFDAVDYDAGPWFRSPRKGIAGVQIDLAYNRADGVITLCEMKRQTAPLGRAVIAEVERKAATLRNAHPRRTIQPVLVVYGPVSKEVTSAGYFQRIVQAEEMFG